MKSLFFILFIAFSLNASTLISYDEVLNQKSNFLCVKSYKVLNNQIIFTSYDDNNYTLETSNLINFNFDDSYSFDETGKCHKDYSNNFGLNYQNYNFIMALFGLILGNTILFLFGASFTRR